MLKRVWELREELLLFLNLKRNACEFVSKMECDEWKFELMLAADVFEKLNELNVKLQEKVIWLRSNVFKQIYLCLQGKQK